MLVFNSLSYISHLTDQAVSDLTSVVIEYTEDISYSLSLVPATVIKSFHSHGFTSLSFEYVLPFTYDRKLCTVKLPGHLYFHPGEEISIQKLRTDLLRGDLSAYDLSRLSEEEI